MDLLIDGNRGIYIPQVFAETLDINQVSPAYNGYFMNLEQDLNELMKGPEYPFYWQVWDNVLDNLEFMDGSTLYQDGDLWVLADGETIEAE